jgi:hypothetical protein
MPDSDDQRIRDALDEGWVGETGLRQTVKRLVRDTRADERAACAEIARKNESAKTVAEIEARATEQR